MARGGRKAEPKQARGAESLPAAKDVAQFAMADGPQRRIVDYANRGRPRAEMSDHDLRRDLRCCLETLGQNAVEPSARLALDDIMAEYSLRGQEAPFDDFPDLLKGYFAAVDAVVQGYSDEQRAQINSDLYDEYNRAHRAKN